jgi:hypothetical protein
MSRRRGRSTEQPVVLVRAVAYELAVAVQLRGGEGTCTHMPGGVELRMHPRGFWI